MTTNVECFQAFNSSEIQLWTGCPADWNNSHQQLPNKQNSHSRLKKKGGGGDRRFCSYVDFGDFFFSFS